MILWHFVNDTRPALIESPIDAREWILTVDFRFIAFDEHKQQRTKSTVPLCLHPTSLIQLLQFWVPRTKEFGEAILGSLRLPFLFQELDPEDEKTTLQILKGLGRFEGADQLSEQAITQVVLNEGLRARLRAQHSDEEEIQIVRDALVKEIRLRADAQAREAAELKRAVEQRGAQLDTAGRAVRTSTEEIQVLQDKLAAESARAADAATQLQKQNAQIENLERQWQRVAETKHKWRSLLSYFGVFLAIVAASFGAWLWAGFAPAFYSRLLGTWSIRALAALITFVTCHLLLELMLREKHGITDLWPFQQVRHFRRFLWTFVILSFVAGVLGNLYANFIQKNMDAQPLTFSTIASPSSTVSLPPTATSSTDGR